MAKTIEFNYEGVDYTLGFSRRSIEKMESDGFKLQDITDKPMSTIPALFRGAFLQHHRFTKQETIDAIFDHIADKDKLFERLAEMYNEPFETLLGETEQDEGNLKWNANW